MKNVTKILFTATILTLLLTGCAGKTNFESQLTGAWYLEGSQETAFILYDDGTCEIAGEYGTGTWNVVNDNQFKLTNYYGEVESATIEKIENDKIMLSFGDVNSTFSKYPASVIEESINESEKEITTETSSENYRDNYILQSIIKPALHDSLHGVPFTIDVDDYFWVEAVDIDNEDERRMLKINLDGKIFMDIPFAGFTGILEDKYLCPNDSVIYDLEGNDITNSFCDNNEEFSGAFQDITGWTVWVYEKIDTYDSSEFIIRAKNLDGTVKAEWSETELENKYEEVTMSPQVKFLGGSWYSSGNMIYNVKNKMDICRDGAHVVEADNDFLFLCFSDGWLSGDSIVLYDKDGSDITPSYAILENDTFWLNRYLGEGMLLLENHDYFIVVDSTGNIPFDINQFSSRGTWGDDKSINEFHNGQAQVEILNEGGIPFTTLINNKGEFLFEPVKGSMGYFDKTNMWKYQYSIYREAEELSCLMDNAGNLIKNTGEVYIKEGEELTSYIVIENGELVVYPVEKID